MGYLQVYTGDGKGKTTAALGLALRAVGAGMNVFIGQFIKGMEYSELKSLQRFSGSITLKQFGRDCFIYEKPTDEDVRLARQGLAEIESILQKEKFQLVIFDEANIAIYYHLFTVEELISVVSNRSASVEVVVTGRRADAKLIEVADLVTEMKEIKHYYATGIEARPGVEF